MEKASKRELKRPYLTLLLVAAIVYFFLAVIWKYFAPLIVAFLVLLAVEPSLDKWSGRLRMGRKPVAYLFIVFILIAISLGIGFCLIPYLKTCDFSWCEEIWKQPMVAKVISYFQEKGLGTVAEWSASAVRISAKILFNIGAYGLSVFLLAGVFRKLKNAMEQQKEGKLLIWIGRDIIAYAKAYLKTQGKLLLIISGICIPALTFIGIRGGWILGLLAGVLDFLPLFGTGIVLIPTALWQFMVQDYIAAVVCIIIFIICAVLREVLEPKFLGNATRLPSIGIWISIYAGLQLFGGSGIFKGPIGYLLICTIYERIQQKE